MKFWDPTTDDLQQFKVADDQLESNLRRVSRRPFLTNHARSRSTDLKSGFQADSLMAECAQGAEAQNQIQLHYRVANQDLIKTLFSHYYTLLLQKNERLNCSYMEKVREWYRSIKSFSFMELEEAFSAFCEDVEMREADPLTRQEAIRSVAQLINNNTNYSVCLEPSGAYPNTAPPFMWQQPQVQSTTTTSCTTVSDMEID